MTDDGQPGAIVGHLTAGESAAELVGLDPRWTLSVGRLLTGQPPPGEVLEEKKRNHLQKLQIWVQGNWGKFGPKRSFGSTCPDFRAQLSGLPFHQNLVALVANLDTSWHHLPWGEHNLTFYCEEPAHGEEQSQGAGVAAQFSDQFDSNQNTLRFHTKFFSSVEMFHLDCIPCAWTSWDAEAIRPPVPGAEKRWRILTFLRWLGINQVFQVIIWSTLRIIKCTQVVIRYQK